MKTQSYSRLPSDVADVHMHVYYTRILFFLEREWREILSRF